LNGDLVKSETLKGHADSVHGVVFVANSGGAQRLVSGAYDNTAKLWEQENDGVWKPLAILKGHTDAVMEVVCSPDGRYIATSSLDRTVRLWSADGQFMKILGTKPKDLAINQAIDVSPDGRWLIAADRRHDGGSVVWSVPEGQEITRYNGHNGTVFQARFRPASADKPLVASTGGDANDICLWDPKTGKEVSRIVGLGYSVLSAAFSPDSSIFSFGQTANGPDTLTAAQPLTASFSIADFALVEITKTDWQRGQLTVDGYSAKPNPDKRSELIISQRNRETCRVTRSQSFDSVRCYAFLPGKGQVVVGSNFGLTLHDAQTGKQLREFVGHTGILWAVAVSPDGKTLLSASNDQTLRMWRLEDVPRDKADEVSSLLNFFFTKDGKDWIAWTNEGYYAASPEGNRLIGWHLNRGIDKAADFAEAWQYAKIFHQPQVVELVLTARSTEKAIELAAQVARIRVPDIIDIRKDRDKLAVPKVSVTSPKQYTRIVGESVQLVGSVMPMGSMPITDVRITVNKRPVDLGRKDLLVRPRENERTVEVPLKVNVPLLPGANLIEVVASTEFATSQPFAIEVQSSAPKLKKPTLYFLGIGCAQYENEALSLKFPDDDIKGIAEALKKQEGKLYEKVVSTTLIDEQVTRREILRAMKKLKTSVTQHDVAIIAVSGHGHADVDGTYYFCPHDIDIEEPTITGIRWTEITEPLKMLPCKVVLCMDTCHAGAVLGPKRGQRNKSTHDAIRNAIADLTSIEAGVIVLTSSTGKEVSIEDAEWKHGAFALALIEALTGRHKVKSNLTKLPADLNTDQLLEISEIDAYITARVKELTKGTQHPVTERGRLPSFPLAVTK
ncbi:MAG: caspase family protein, partial [Planctomycetaceae bacterium]|nr:caspase family protein [Planctomycetaceae bacterium]